MNKTILLTGLVLGGVAIILGAFGAHGLKRALGPDELNTFETGVKYQLYHALFLILLSMMTMATEGMKRVVFYLIISGVILFSFSIYLLATNSLTGFDFRKIGFVTPIGGLLMILGWGYLFFSILTKK
jgi:uncharacterized membrane protein YgdD (TMEM256/DUF423 family)